MPASAEAKKRAAERRKKAAAAKKAAKEAAEQAKKDQNDAVEDDNEGDEGGQEGDDGGKSSEEDESGDDEDVRVGTKKYPFPAGRQQLLPAVLFNVDTATFDHEAKQPNTNPDLSIWALMNAIKFCSTKTVPIIQTDKPVNKLVLRLKLDSATLTSTPYACTIRTSQNADAIVKYMYGKKRSKTEKCGKCTDGNGGLVGCYTHEKLGPSCANCDWNRSGSCSLAGSARKAVKRKSAAIVSISDDEDEVADWIKKGSVTPNEVLRVAGLLERMAKKMRQSSEM